jgi:hypothetical protein
MSAPFISISEDRRYLIISRCEWIYPNATEDEAGPRDERRRALLGGRDGDIVLRFAEGAWLEPEHVALMLAEVGVGHRDDGPHRLYCTFCGRKSWDEAEFGKHCNMPQPGGVRCVGTVIRPDGVKEVGRG